VTGAPPARDSWWRLTADVASAKILVWLARFGRDAELTREAHLFFADRYHRLSEIHRAGHNIAKAERLEAKAEEHGWVVGHDGPPFAAAMAMPRPRRFVVTNAVSGRGMDGDDAA
jgi:hypothetical protein